MNTLKNTLALSIALTLAIPLTTYAENFYGSVFVGAVEHTGDSQPFGQNIAIDSDFPGNFESGSGDVTGLALGYRFNDNFRLEARYGYHDSDFSDRKIGTGSRENEEYILNVGVESKTFSLEGFYDFANDTAFTPYVKAGIGYADNTYSAKLGGQGVAAFDPFDGATDGYYDGYSDGSSNNLMWNVGVGFTYDVSENLALFTEYQYVSFDGEMKTGQDSFTDGFAIDDVQAHEVLIGLKMSF